MHLNSTLQEAGPTSPVFFLSQKKAATDLRGFERIR
jgi:hypothetical protein